MGVRIGELASTRAPVMRGMLASTDGGSGSWSQDDESESRSRIRNFLVFAWAFVGVSLMLGAWSFATPLGAAPDEPSHIIQAAAIVRGQFDEPDQHTDFGPLANVYVPEWVADVAALPRCFAFRPQRSAGCAPKLVQSSVSTTASTQFSHNPPLYYVIVGLPSLVLTGVPAVYAMRLTGDLFDAALVALGIYLILRYHTRRRTSIGVLIALSPMALFLMAVVSSSALEIAAGFAAWCAGLCVIERPVVPCALAVWTSIAAATLILARPTSPADALIIGVVLMTLVGWRDLGRRLNRSLRPIWISVVVTTAVAGIFLFFDGLPGLLGGRALHPVSLLRNMTTTLQLTGPRLRQMIGDFGWLDTPVPTWVVIVWTSALAGISTVALVLSARCRRALPVLAALIVAMPLVFESSQINAVGAYWQGRYWLPVAIGFPLVASSFEGRAVGRHRRRARMRWNSAVIALVLGVVLIVAQIASFEQALRRYETGLGSNVAALARWLPPGGPVRVVIVFALGAVTTLALVVVMLRPQRELAGGELNDEADQTS